MGGIDTTFVEEEALVIVHFFLFTKFTFFSTIIMRMEDKTSYINFKLTPN